MANQTDLAALHFPFRRRALTADELLLTKPFFISGVAPQNKHGVLLIHGFTGTPAIWHQLINQLAPLGLSISCPLLPGHGLLSAALLSLQWIDWFNSVENALLKLAYQCNQIDIIGHSLGGTLALLLASKHPVIRKLFLVSPAIYPKLYFNFLIHSGVAVFLKKLGVQFVPSIGGNLKKKDAWEVAYPRIAIHALEEVYACMKVTQQVLPNITNQMIIFQSRHDLLVPTNLVSKWVKKLGSSHVEIIWFDNSYHVIPLDNDRDQFTKTVLDKMILNLGQACVTTPTVND